MTADDSTSPSSVPQAVAADSLEEAIRSNSDEILIAAASQPALGEDLALALLKRTDLSPDVLVTLGKNSAVMKSRNVKLALVCHPRTPRRISIGIVRQLFTFDLMRVALTPGVAGDLKMAAEEALIKRLESVPLGQRISLARRASTRVAGALLLDTEPRVFQAALENPRLTEVLIARALSREEASPLLANAVARHPKWSLRQEIQAALTPNESTGGQ